MSEASEDMNYRSFIALSIQSCLVSSLLSWAFIVWPLGVLLGRICLSPIREVSITFIDRELRASQGHVRIISLVMVIFMSGSFQVYFSQVNLTRHLDAEKYFQSCSYQFRKNKVKNFYKSM